MYFESQKSISIGGREEDVHSDLDDALRLLIGESKAHAAALFILRDVKGSFFLARGEGRGLDGLRRAIDSAQGRRVPDPLRERILCPSALPQPPLKWWNEDSSTLLTKLGNSQAIGRDSIDVLIFSEARCLGWLGLWRDDSTGRFPPGERETLEELVGDVRHRLLEAIKLEDQLLADREGVVLLRRDGVLTHISPAVERWFNDRHRQQLVELMETSRSIEFIGKHFLFGMAVTIKPLNGLAVEPVYMIQFECPQLPRPSLSTMLTPAQLEVATVAMKGITIAQIADELTRSPHTIKTHLRDIYERLGVSSRLELTTYFSA